MFAARPTSTQALHRHLITAGSFCDRDAIGMSPKAKLTGLESWMHAAGFAWSASTVSLCGGTDSSDGFSVGALRDIREGETLCEIPKSAVLSIQNSAIADLIQKERLGGGLGLILAIMHEVSIGKESKW